MFQRSLGDILAKRSSFDVIDKYDINNDHKLDSIELELLAFDHGIEWPLSATYAENLVEYNDLNGDKALDRWGKYNYYMYDKMLYEHF